MSQSLSVSFPAPTGVIARYVGSTGGSTTRYYWVQTIYPSGFSILRSVAMPWLTLWQV